jgi:hypothetical protein
VDVNDIFLVVKPTDADWWEVEEVSTNSRGFVPSNQR